MNRKNIFLTTASIFSFILIILMISFVFQVNAKSQQLQENMNQIHQFSSLGFENKNLKEKAEKLQKEGQNLKIKADLKKIDNLLNESQNIKKNIENEYKNELEKTQNGVAESLELLQKTMKNNEFIKVENTEIYRDLLTHAKNKQKSKDLGELNLLNQDLKKGLTLYKNEVEDSKKADLISSLKTTLNDVENLQTYANEKNNWQIQSQINDFKTRVDNFTALENVKKTSFEELEKVSQNEILPILAKTKSDVEKLKVEEAAIRQKLIDAEKNNWQNQSAPQAPLGATVPKQIFVKLSTQRMYLYDQGEIIKSGAVTTGKEKFETVTGTYAIYAKKKGAVLKSPFPDIEYEIPVDYWIPFFEGYGFHDAKWRKGKFGDQSYKKEGSHGCVNTPDNLIKFIYDWADIGTKVVIVD